jgi:histidinol dehydrogenase
MKLPVLRYGIDNLDKVFSRSQINDDNRTESVRNIIADVKTRGDAALYDYSLKFDGLKIDKDTIRVSQEELDNAYSSVDPELLAAMKRAKESVLDYHKRQLISSETDGKTGWMMKPLNRAGIYVPGGTAPYPSSVLMCVLPAVAAGVKEIVVTTPNPRNALTLAALKECGVKEVYRVGGAQAVAALAYGTETIRKTDIIAGPGNVYVTLAKKEVFGSVAIDMLAGPSEILVIADDTAVPEYVIADLLSQAEHDRMSAAILITTSEKLAEYVSNNLFVEGMKLSRKDIISESLKANSSIIKVDTVEQALEISDRIAPEHLELCMKDASEVALKVSNAGAVFVGNYSPEPLGDYVAGPSHVLPTSGTARHFSVLNALTFMKRISRIEYNKDDFKKVQDDIIKLAECEGFAAHALSAKVRKA